jgi:nucleoside-diphosphate-sugar epimerase
VHVLLTGAFGNLGSATLRELLSAGHQVRCFDQPSRSARRAARALPGAAEVVWGDIGDREALARAAADRDAVIHDAALIPPASERDPGLTHRVNVEGTRNVLEACRAAPAKPRLVFASSVSVFGPTPDRPPPRRADEPVHPTDHYSRSKLACEEMIRASGLAWVILRLGAAAPEVPRGLLDFDAAAFFRVDPDTRVEFVHPCDVALAQTRAIEVPEAVGRILLIGGGPSCQVRMRDLGRVYFEAMGIGRLPDAAFGREPFYTDWMDTSESQALLGYQRHSFDDFRRAVERRMRFARPLLRPFGALIRRRLLRQSAAWRAYTAGQEG